MRISLFLTLFSHSLGRFARLPIFMTTLTESPGAQEKTVTALRTCSVNACRVAGGECTPAW